MSFCEENSGFTLSIVVFVHDHAPIDGILTGQDASDGIQFEQATTGQEMAKTRHRTFEIFDFLQEASEALSTKSDRLNTYALDPDLWRFHQLDTAIRPSGVVHVTFKQHADSKPKSSSDFGDELSKDLVDLGDLLTNGSRVLLDFEGLLAFDTDSIARLTEFKDKLQNKGSRVALCNLEPTVRASFFPNLSTNANS